MSKSRNSSHRWFDDEDEYETTNRIQSREKNKQKRIQSALKSRNITELVRAYDEWEDEEDEL